MDRWTEVDNLILDAIDQDTTLPEEGKRKLRRVMSGMRPLARLHLRKKTQRHLNAKGMLTEEGIPTSGINLGDIIKEIIKALLPFFLEWINSLFGDDE